MYDNRHFGVYHKAARVGMVLLATGAALHGLNREAAATPATLGFYPATDIYGKGSFHLDVDTYGVALKTDSVVSTGLTYGIGPERNGLLGRSEIGFDYLLSLGGSTPSTDTFKRLLFNAKTQLYNNDAAGTRIVGGVWGLGNKEIFAPNVGYLLGSKTFKWGRIHLGVAHSFADEEIIAVGADADKTSLHLAYDRYITPKLQFAVDFYSGKNAYAGVQPTLYYYVNDKASFGLGLMHFNAESVAPARNQIYLAFDYNFGGGSTPAATPAATLTPAPVP
ncbi:MAG TPA: hypothetical protein VNA16_10560 [Abditibacteriaceae bacterium]|nr:hypothetical protein [Abditibacteriaceae bacterium]